MVTSTLSWSADIASCVTPIEGIYSRASQTTSCEPRLKLRRPTEVRGLPFAEGPSHWFASAAPDGEVATVIAPGASETGSNRPVQTPDAPRGVEGDKDASGALMPLRRDDHPVRSASPQDTGSLPLPGRPRRIGTFGSAPSGRLHQIDDFERI
jgi:hypothetical protein